MTMRTRFAPSPTGYLHIGGARTALFCWLYAKKHQGQFILRVEDTDQARSTQASVTAILESMAWLKLSYDEGPIFQSDRFPRYQAVVDQLLAEGKAYRCYCTQARLDELRATQMENKQKPRYDGRCRHLTQHPVSGTPHVVRFKTPELGFVRFDDFIRGEITVANAELDDLIIMRTDGTPTYNFTVVVDDMDMGMTHVIRGDDHINNTPRQIHLFEALGVKPPIYGHVPMILGADGQRLSKRHGAVSVMQYHEEGFLPEALLNYLVRLGWSHGDQEIFSITEMLDYFDVAHINRAPATFNPEKLLWLNAHYIKTLPVSRLIEALTWHYQKLAIPLNDGPPLSAVLPVYRERCQTLVELAVSTRYLFEPVTHYDEKVAEKQLTPEALPLLIAFLNALKKTHDWTPDGIHAVMHAVIAELGVGFGRLGQPLRLALTGITMSPPLNEVMALLARETVYARLDQAIQHMTDKVLAATQGSDNA